MFLVLNFQLFIKERKKRHSLTSLPPPRPSLAPFHFSSSLQIPLLRAIFRTLISLAIIPCD